MASEDSLALPLLPSDRAIVVPACDDLALVILQGVLKLNAHLSSSARSQSFADLERLLWDMDPPNLGPFRFMFRRWSEAQRSRNMKNRVLALLSFHGDFDPSDGRVSTLRSLAKRLRDERDTSEETRFVAAEADRARVEARATENARQEGALGALPRVYGVDAPRVPEATEARQRQNDEACNLLAANPRSQNNHARPVALLEPPPAVPPPALPPPALPPIVAAAAVITPPTANTTNGPRPALLQQQPPPPQLPTLQGLAEMAVPPPAGGGHGGRLPAAPGVNGPANNRGRAVALQRQIFAANGATAGVGDPIVVDDVDAAAMRRTRRVDNMDAIDGINRAMLEATKMIASTIGKVRKAPTPPRAPATTAVSSSIDFGSQIDSLYKRLKKAKEENITDSVRRYERLIVALEKKEEEEIEARLRNY